MAARIEHVAARQVEWKTEAERATLAHLGSTLSHLLGGQQVEPAELIVGTEVAPGRTRRALLPAWLVRGVAHVAPFALRAVPPRGSRAPSERPCVAHAMSPAWLLVYSTDRIRVLALAARHCAPLPSRPRFDCMRRVARSRRHRSRCGDRRVSKPALR